MTANQIIYCRIQQLGSAVIDIQRKLNHEIKEREIDENALSNRYENSLTFINRCQNQNLSGALIVQKIGLHFLYFVHFGVWP